MTNSPTRIRVLVDAASGAEEGEGQRWAETLALSLCRAREAGEDELLLAATSEGLELRCGVGRRQGYARVDFTKRGGRGRPSEILRRAVGRKAGFVVDATAGFGDDAIALAGLGHRVLAFELSAVVAALLEDGQRRAQGDARLREIVSRLEIRCGDSLTLLKCLDEIPDAVYIDPMYPRSSHSRSALPRLQMQLLRQLAGADTDGEALLGRALEIGSRRVVVKRPLRVAPLPGPLTASHPGKLVRYDVYQVLGSKPRK